jgi:O-antigen ligase
LSVSNLVWENSLAERAAEVTGAGVLVVNGLHVDANFSALYATTWVFLIMAYPAETWFRRWFDGVIVGLLIGQLVVSASKGAALALLVGGGFVLVGLVIRGGLRRFAMVPLLAAALTTIGVVGLLLAVDTADGEAALRNNADIRWSQVAQEAGRASELWSVILPDADEVQLTPIDAARPGAADRSQIWVTYGRTFRSEPLTGVGYGVTADGYSYAHNAPLESAAGGGIVGLVGWLVLLVGLVVLAVRNVRKSARGLALAAALLVVGVGSLVLTTNYEPLVGLAIGLTVAPHLQEGLRAPLVKG